MSSARAQTVHSGDRATSGWRTGAHLRVAQLEAHLQRLGTQPGSAAVEVEGLVCELTRTKEAIASSGPDEVWPSLHRIEEDIAGLARDGLLWDYVLWAVDHGSDPAVAGHKAITEGRAWKRVAEAAEAGRLPDPVDGLPGDLRTALHQAHAAIDTRHLDANDCHKRLKWTIIGLSTLSLLILAAAGLLGSLPFLVGAENFQDVPQIQVATLVALGGLVGGAVGAVPAFTGTQRDLYRLAYVRAGTRLAMGVLAALIGVSLVGAGWVTGLTGDSAPALFAVALAFGLTQEPVTKALEGKLATALPDSSE